MMLHLVFTATCVVLLGTAVSGSHVCDRNCTTNAGPMTCRYNFTVEEYLVLSKACFNCPTNITDCNRPQCIAANGVRRILTVANRQMPGPTIAVCKNDIIDVNMINMAGSNLASTIHWHGQNQQETPYMDGVPFVTQCPVLSRNNFRYKFKAAEVGTYFWHSHIGFERTDGLTGPLIVRQPKCDEPNGKEYDFDLSEHYIMVTDWINKTGEHMYYEMYQSDAFYGPYLTTILVNGRGRVEPFNSAINRDMPVSVFRVRQGFRYRFRICSAASFMCPMQVSVDNHNLTVIGADGDAVQPIPVDSFVIGAGERFDFVINANQPIGNYWIRFHGCVSCAITFGRAILRYEGATISSPSAVLTLQNTERIGSVLNPVNFLGGSRGISILKLVSKSPSDPALKLTPDRQIFLPFDLYPMGDPVFFDPVLYPWDSLPVAFRHLTPMLDEIAYVSPASPLLSQYLDTPSADFCNSQTINKNCTSQFCSCIHLIKIKLNAVVELILMDTAIAGDGNSHPFHLHGHHFRIVAEGNNTRNVTAVKDLDRRGLIKRNLNSPVKKDTVNVPSGGFAIVRFYANNPGFWLFHCHVELHSDAGMTLVFQVGELTDMVPVPPRFPRCGDF